MDALQILKETYDRRISAIEGILIAQNAQLRKDRETLVKALESCLGGLRAAVRVKDVALIDHPNFQPGFDATLSDIALPQHCACGQLLQDVQELERHVERGCYAEG